MWLNQQEEDTDGIWKSGYGERWQTVKQIRMEELRKEQLESLEERERKAEKVPTNEKLWQVARKASISPKIYKDDLGSGLS